MALLNLWRVEQQPKWSSHQEYAGRRKPPAWLCLDWLRFWGRNRRAAQREYRQEMAAGFGKPVSSPWEEWRGGLVLGFEELWEEARRLLGKMRTEEQLRWREREGMREARDKARRLVAKEEDGRVRIWARVRLGGERSGEGIRLSRCERSDPISQANGGKSGMRQTGANSPERVESGNVKNQ